MNDALTSKEKEELVLGIHDDQDVAEFKAWSEAKAAKIAADMGIELTEDHWQVIRFMRLHFENTGTLRHARELTEVLNERFESEGGSRFLYRLFPNGPVSQGCRIAGVPVPHDAENLSFGSSF